MPDHSSPACRRKINRHLAGRPGNVCEVAGRMHVGGPEPVRETARSRSGGKVAEPLGSRVRHVALSCFEENRYFLHPWVPVGLVVPAAALQTRHAPAGATVGHSLLPACGRHGPAEMSDACGGFFPGSSSRQYSCPRVRSPHPSLSSGSALGLDTVLSGSTSR